jgi:hypothetical protein
MAFTPTGSPQASAPPAGTDGSDEITRAKTETKLSR